MPLEECLVALAVDGEDSPVGAGFLIADRLVATCAHVVNEALRRGIDATDRPRPSDKIALQVRTPQSVPLLATVATFEEAWSPPPTRRALGADFCVLSVEGDLPASLAPADLGQSSDLTGRSFRTVGFPQDWEYDTAAGQIVGSDQGFFLLRPDAASRLALLSRPKTMFASAQARAAGIIYHGFSGAPVAVDGAVVGMLVEARQLIPDATAFMLPASAFPRRFSRRARQISVDQPTAVRSAEPGSPSAVLVTKYLEALADESSSDEIFISRKVCELKAAESLPPTDQAKSEPSEETIASATERVRTLVLLGEPGLGKSTVLSHFEAETATATLRERERSPTFSIPIRIQLKDYGGEDELETLLAARVNAMLRSKRAALSLDSTQSTRIMKAWLNDPAVHFLILVDAVDELPPQHYEKAVTALRTLLRYPQRFVISCRSADYDQSLTKFARSFVLIPLQPPEIKQHFSTLLGAKGEALFDEQVGPDRQVLSLASNALFLGMIIEIAKRGIHVPRNRGLLFRVFVEAMIERRRKGGARPQVPFDLVLTFMAALAAKALDKNVARPGPGELRTWGLPSGYETIERILSEARKYRFVSSDGTGQHYVEFIHPLCRDYFAAEHLNSLSATSKPTHQSALHDRLWLRQWREAIIMQAALSPRSADLIRVIAEHLQDEVASGKLFAQEFSLWDWVVWIGNIASEGTKVDFLVQCWETSSSRSDQATRNIVISALRDVIRHAGAALADSVAAATTRKPEVPVRHLASTIFECTAALKAVRRIGAVEVTPELDELFAQRPQNAHEGSFFITLKNRLWPSVFEQARIISAELKSRAELS